MVGKPSGRGAILQSPEYTRRAVESTGSGDCRTTFGPCRVSVGTAPGNSPVVVLIHAENLQDNRVVRSLPFQSVFILIPVRHHVADGDGQLPDVGIGQLATGDKSG